MNWHIRSVANQEAVKIVDPFLELFDVGPDRIMLWNDRSSGLRAILAIDSLTLGPAVGGIRTQNYQSFRHAFDDARKLAAAMTLKCAIAGLDAGGAKTVVLDHPGLNRAAAFRRIGELIDELRGIYWAAGDLGTTPDDLNSAANATRYVNRDVPVLADATAQTVVNGIRACVEARGGTGLTDVRVAIQGCGAIGSGVAWALAAAGSQLVVSDIVPEQASRLAAQTGARVQAPEEILSADVDIVAPCGKGGTISRSTLASIKAWGICGGANNQLADEDDTGQALVEAGILYVPDFLASSGGVIAGTAKNLMGRDPEPLLAGTFETARSILMEAQQSQSPSSHVAKRLAHRRIDAARAEAADRRRAPTHDTIAAIPA